MQAIWQPNQQRIETTELTRFMHSINQEHGLEINDYQQLHAYSTENIGAFWQDLIDFCSVIYHTPASQPFLTGDHMVDTEWFPGMQINFAENLLRRKDQAIAIVFENEAGEVTEISYLELYQKVSQLQQKMRDLGIVAGDRVAGFLPNLPETIIAMLATTSLGAVWSSTSPDFGINGVVDRFGQIQPKLLFTTDGYFYNGKTFDLSEKIEKISVQLTDLQQVVVIPFTTTAEAVQKALPTTAVWDHWLANTHPEQDIEFTPVGFDHPLYILYSSGTTGKPKCIVHRTGGILLQHLKELVLHSNVRPDSRLFYFTTCGWMMWNWMVSTLATGASLTLFDGSPFYPNGERLFDMIDRHDITHFGTSAKWLAAVEKADIKPAQSHDLSTLEVMFSTGSPLLPEQYEFVYQHVKQEMSLASISGGTDICSCFALGNPNLPVYKGQLQCLGLGMDVHILDDDGHSVTTEPGELSCLQPFPSMPVYFWNDPNHEKYKAAYFERFENVWCHSDRAEITPQGGMIIYGRSDTTLNPGGVRIGTAEIYRQVEKVAEVKDSVVISQDWDDDVRIVLFVVLQDGIALDQPLIDRIKQTIRKNTTPRHVPAVILSVPDVPRTISGKVVELAVRHVVHGQTVKNTDALANPDVLAFFSDRPELQA
ncbi:acetoacetate--CoA ligase [Marinicella sp. W31]|uniref:acetoacetate--CoA ligase n=1 Tax=Marinicella sp. W31 TaxID=3023713 RepID=UPI003756BB49